MLVSNSKNVELSEGELDNFVDELLNEFDTASDIPEVSRNATSTVSVKATVDCVTKKPDNFNADSLVDEFFDFVAYDNDSGMENNYKLSTPSHKTNFCNMNHTHSADDNTKNVNPTFDDGDFDFNFEFDPNFELNVDDDAIQNLLNNFNNSNTPEPLDGSASSHSDNTLIVPLSPQSTKRNKPISANGRVTKPKLIKNKTRREDVNKKVKLFVDSKTEARIGYCLKQMRKSREFNEKVNIMQRLASHIDGSYLIDRVAYERLMMLFLLPNNLTINDFTHQQMVDGWTYFQNKQQSLERLPLRLCHQRANFYEPFVKRERKVDGRSKREGLCPYCKVDFTKLDKCFYDLTGSNYQHHVAKNHGVWNAGYEMPPPVIFKKGNQYSAVCNHCKDHPTLARTNFTDLNTTNCLESQLIGYYRHLFSKHSITKKKMPVDFKRITKGWFIMEDPYMERMLYEPVN